MKKYISLLIVPFLFGFVLHCNRLKPKRIECFYVDSFMKKERNAIIKEGDTTAYKAYLASVIKNKRIPRSNSFYYSFVMAICYEYTPANYDAYRTIIAVYPNVNKMDEETKRLCVFFLKRGADLKDVRCLEVFKHLKVDYHKRPN